MRRFQVGTLLVMEDPPAAGLPIGIVTDRDLALQGFASEASTVGSVMTPVLATIDEEADVHEAFETKRANGVRRLVVTGPGRGLRGILSIDDVVDGLSADRGSS
ncbi:MAG: CBS domain-containing protein [Usitatibacter sp.]